MIELLCDTERDGEVIELGFTGTEYRGLWPCVSRANLAQHVEGRRIAVDGGVPPWYRPP
jgi:hypothetical protein